MTPLKNKFSRIMQSTKTVVQDLTYLSMTNQKGRKSSVVEINFKYKQLKGIISLTKLSFRLEESYNIYLLHELMLLLLLLSKQINFLHFADSTNWLVWIDSDLLEKYSTSKCNMPYLVTSLLACCSCFCSGNDASPLLKFSIMDSSVLLCDISLHLLRFANEVTTFASVLKSPWHAST